jgi:hypothetical protein
MHVTLRIRFLAYRVYRAMCGHSWTMMHVRVCLKQWCAVSCVQIKQILEGQLFPMKALGYFAVVTGKGTILFHLYFPFFFCLESSAMEQ